MGNVIENLLLEAKTSQNALADAAGISRSSLSKMRRGELGCTVDELFALAAVVGVPRHEVFARCLRDNFDIDERNREPAS